MLLIPSGHGYWIGCDLLHDTYHNYMYEIYMHIYLLAFVAKSSNNSTEYNDKTSYGRKQIDACVSRFLKPFEEGWKLPSSESH